MRLRKQSDGQKTNMQAKHEPRRTTTRSRATTRPGKQTATATVPRGRCPRVFEKPTQRVPDRRGDHQTVRSVQKMEGETMMLAKNPECYTEFINQKSQSRRNFGYEPTFMPEWLFDFQSYIVDWSIRSGRAAILADCGLGKTPMQLITSDSIISTRRSLPG